MTLSQQHLERFIAGQFVYFVFSSDRCPTRKRYNKVEIGFDICEDRYQANLRPLLSQWITRHREIQVFALVDLCAPRLHKDFPHCQHPNYAANEIGLHIARVFLLNQVSLES